MSNPHHDTLGARPNLGRRSAAAAARTLLCLALLVPSVDAAASGRTPGSLLLFPEHHSSLLDGVVAASFVSVTNVDRDPQEGATAVRFIYVNGPAAGSQADSADDFDLLERVEYLSAADTFSVRTDCHDAAWEASGFLLVVAEDPGWPGRAWSFNRLVGSMCVVTPQGGVVSSEALSLASPLPSGAATDLDGDGMLDFDGLEYEGLADRLLVPSALVNGGPSLVLVSLTGGPSYVTTVRLDAFCDDGFPLAAMASFRVHRIAPLEELSPAFTPEFLAANTPSDPEEVDLDCDGAQDAEAIWIRIDGVSASSGAQSVADPALVVSVAQGRDSGWASGDLAWESAERQFNGKFLFLGSVDPEL
jgi:hypothetical protein